MKKTPLTMPGLKNGDIAGPIYSLVAAASICLVFLSCSEESPKGPTNVAPVITSNNTAYAAEDQFFAFRVEYHEPDGPDTTISYENFASWQSIDADSLCGTPTEGVPDTSFRVIVSDGIAADTLEVTLTVLAINDAPRIISADTTEATGGVFFSYRVEISDPDGPAPTIQFENLPFWLDSGADSTFGIPPDGSGDTYFTIIASDGILSDTMSVTIRMIPCLVVYGDSRTGHDIHQQIVDLMVDMQPEAVFHTGDLVANGYISAQWDTFNLITSQLRATAEFYPALGNHENQSPLYFENFDLPNNEQWYSIEKNGIHFIILNSCVAIGVESDQYQWLESDLAGIDDSIKFIAAAFHHPPYSTGPHTEDEKGLREILVPLFEQHGVDIVFNGHDHCYERSFCGGIYYIVAGGGGAPLYDQAREHPCSQSYLADYHFCKLSSIGDRLVVKVYDTDSQIIDRFELSK
jgi:predicted phosphodiesterase